MHSLRSLSNDLVGRNSRCACSAKGVCYRDPTSGLIASQANQDTIIRPATTAIATEAIVIKTDHPLPFRRPAVINPVVDLRWKKKCASERHALAIPRQ